jgi:hypothetical protein
MLFEPSALTSAQSPRSGSCPFAHRPATAFSRHRRWNDKAGTVGPSANINQLDPNNLAGQAPQAVHDLSDHAAEFELDSGDDLIAVEDWLVNLTIVRASAPRVTAISRRSLRGPAGPFHWERTTFRVPGLFRNTYREKPRLRLAKWTEYISRLA